MASGLSSLGVSDLASLVASGLSSEESSDVSSSVFASDLDSAS